ncbi:hypothetical protein [Salinibacter ruber]|uniref:hypothetical protein n=1 Tax=Salinibacter ruber TaxID=146919 RepID=UPI0021681E12|nr:hypothetical protein [Salinibacter ruber]MCS4198111.1 hypothetical protein [Salinibacter ruber]
MSKKDISEFKSLHSGDRVFIIGNGPSLKKTPMNKMKKETTIAMNRINLLFGETTWRPDYYIYYDIAYGKKNVSKKTLEHVEKCIEQSRHSFLPENSKDIFGDRSDISYFVPKNISRNLKRENLKVKERAIKKDEIEKIWSTRVDEKIYNFGSTISAAGQLAAYMGFEQIFFVGTDLYGIKERSSSLIVDILGKILPSGVCDKLSKYKEDHFDPDYTKNGNRIENRKVLNRNIIQTHKVIKIASEKFGFEVYNATIGGKLEVYQRKDLEKII